MHAVMWALVSGKVSTANFQETNLAEIGKGSQYEVQNEM